MSAERAPLVSVCIANYNGEAFVAECIESVLNQLDAPAFEIIVHDDASSDGSVGIIERYPDVRLIASTENVGFCVSNNRMATVARGSYLLLLNNDAVLADDALNELAALSSSDPADPILSLPQRDYDSDQLLDRGFLLDPFANPVPVKEEAQAVRAMVMGSCLWISRALWERIGGFPAWMGSIGEDLYLCCFSRMLGHPVYVCPGSHYWHRVGRSFGGGKVSEDRLVTTRRRRALSERNKTLVLLIFLPLPALFLVIPLHALALILEGFLLATALRKPRLLTDVYLAALAYPFHVRHELAALRRRAQSERVVTWANFFKPTLWTPWKLRLLARHGIPMIR